MGRVSRSELAMLERLRAVEIDASSPEDLAARALTILESVIGFDESYILALDQGSLLFTRILAYRGSRFPRFVEWLRDVYLLREREVVPWVAFPELLREHGGVLVAHERIDRWIGSAPRPADVDRWTRVWRDSGSPPGGGLRAGFADRGRWVAALQAARWAPGDGFRPHDVAILRRAAPGLGRALRRLLETGWFDRDAADRAPLGPGHLLFDPDRHPAYIDALGEAWIGRIPEDGVLSHGMDVPVAAQALVNHLGSSEVEEASSRLADRFGLGLILRAGRARSFDVSLAAIAGGWVHLTIQADALAGRFARTSLTPRQRQVAQAVASGLSDASVAERLGIAAVTVHEHVAALHAAFGTSSRAQLVSELNVFR
jgi:DNA-binding CsgD family transcriptional regulator